MAADQTGSYLLNVSKVSGIDDNPLRNVGSKLREPETMMRYINCTQYIDDATLVRFQFKAIHPHDAFGAATW